MTTTDDILALAVHATPASAGANPIEQAADDLIRFATAVTRGMNTDVVRALRALRPGSLPDSPAWRAWLTATAAAAAILPLTAPAEPPVAQASPSLAASPTPPSLAASPAPPSLAARFAVCAAASALGDDCAGAVAAGTGAATLIQSRLAESGAAEQVGWSVPAVSAVIGAGLAAGMMLGLREPPLRHALGICATQAAGLLDADRTDAGPLQIGKAAFNAVEAVHLANLGFTSSRDPLDGRRGLFALFDRQT